MAFRQKPTHQATPPPGHHFLLPGLDAWGDPLPPGALFRTGTLRVQHGVTGQLCFSPDGRLLAAVGHDHTIRLWEAATGKTVLVLPGHQGGVGRPYFLAGVNCLAFSADGKTLVSGGEDRSIRLWDVGSGKQVSQFLGHEEGVRKVSLAPCDTWLASGDGHDIRFWDLKRGKQTRVLPDGAAISADGRLVAVKSHDNAIRIRNTATGIELSCLEGNTEYEYSATFLPDGKTLLTIGHSRGVTLWEVATGKPIHHIDNATAPLAVSPNGKVLASGFCWRDPGVIRLWNLAAGKEVRRLRGHLGDVSSLAFSPDGKVLASLGRDRTLRRWDIETGEELDPQVGHQAAVKAITFSPDGRFLASGGADRTVRLWDPVTGREVQRFGASREVVHGLAFLGDADTLLSQNDVVPQGECSFRSEDDALVRFRLWDVAGGRKRRHFTVRKTFIRPMAFSPARQTLAYLGSRVCTRTTETGFEGYTPIRLLHPASGKERAWKTNLHGTKAMAFSPDGSLLAVVGDYIAMRRYGEVSLWDVNTGKEHWKHTIRFQSFRAVAFSPDGKILATGGNDIKLWDPATGKELGKLEEGRRLLQSAGYALDTFLDWEVGALPEGHGHVAFSPDGRTLATCGPGTSVILWELATGRKRRQFAGHEVSCLAFSPDGRLLATGGLDTLVMAWDLTGRMEQGLLRSGPADDRSLDALWPRLADHDATAAYDAVWALVAMPPRPSRSCESVCPSVRMRTSGEWIGCLPTWTAMSSRSARGR
jgi:WD40 repeat protein